MEWFDIWYEERAHATMEVPAERRSGPPMRTVPKYATINELLGLDEDSNAPLTDEQRAIVDDLVSGRLDPLAMLNLPDDG